MNEQMKKLANGNQPTRLVERVQTIDTVSEPDISDFYKLWAAANAVDTLCVIKGKAGMAVGNGEFCGILSSYFFLVWFGLFSLIFFSRGIGEVLAFAPFHFFFLSSLLFHVFLSCFLPSCPRTCCYSLVLSFFVAPAFQFHR